MITKMNLKNVGNQTLSSYPLEKITVFLGENGSGKSTIINGLSSFMMKNLPGNFVTRGATEGKVDIVFDDGSTYAIRKNDKTTTFMSNGKKITKKTYEENLENQEGLSMEAIEAVLSSGQGLLDLKPDQFLKVMASVITGNIQVSQLYNLMNLNDDEKKALFNITAKQNLTAEDLEQIYKELTKQNTENKKKETHLSGEIQALQANVPTRKRILAEKEMETWKALYSKAQNYKEEMEKYEASMKKMEAFQKKSEEMKKVLNQIAVTAPDTNALEGTKRKLNEAKIEKARLEMDLETSNKTRKTFDDILKNLKTNICPISKKLVCKTDKTSVIQEVKDNLHDIERMITSQTDRITEVNSRITTYKQVLNKMNEETDKYRRYQMMQSQFNQLMLQKPAVMSMPVPVKYTLDECNQKMAELNQEIAQFDLFDMGEAKKKELDQLAATNLLISDLKAKFAPKGLVYQVIGKLVEDQLNNLIEEERKELQINEKYHFTFDEGLYLFVEKNGINLEVKHLSAGERFLTQLILISMISRMTKFGYCLIDNIDMLDKNNLGKVMAFVKSDEFKKRFKNIVFCGVNHVDTIETINNYVDKDLLLYQI